MQIQTIDISSNQFKAFKSEADAKFSIHLSCGYDCKHYFRRHWLKLAKAKLLRNTQEAKRVNQYFGYPGNIEQIVQARGFYCWRRSDAGRSIGWIGRRAKI